MANVVDTLNIKIESSSTDAESGIDKLIKTLGKLKSVTNKISGIDKKGTENIQGLAKAVDTLAKIGESSGLNNVISNLKKLGKLDFSNLNSAKKVISNVSGLINAPSVNPIDASVFHDVKESFTQIETAAEPIRNAMSHAIEGTGQVAESADEATSSIEKTKSALDRVGESGKKIKQIFTDTKLADFFIDASTKSDMLNMKLDDLKFKLQAALQPDSGASNTVITDLTLQTLKLKEQIAKLTPAPVNRLAFAFDVVKNKVKQSIKPLGNFFRSIRRIAMYRAIRAFLSTTTQGLKEGTNNVYQYSKAIGGKLASSLDSISTNFLYFKNSIGAAVAPLINSLAPAVEYVVNKFIDLINVLNQVFAKLSGATTWTKAVRYPKEYAEAADAATAANKELQSSILGIDELNVLNDNSSSSGGAAVGGMDYSQMFQEIPLTGESDRLVGIFKDVLWYATAIAAALAAWKIGKFLQDLGLTKIKLNHIVGIAMAIAGAFVFVKGAIDAWTNGADLKNFTEMLIGAAGIIGGLAIAFGGVGAAIGGIIAGLGLLVVGIKDAVKNGLNEVNGVMIALGGMLAGAGIGFLIGGPIGAAIGALVGLAVGLLTDLIIWIVQNWEDIKLFFKNLWESIKGFFSDAWEWIKGVFAPVGAWFSQKWEDVKTAFKPAVEWFSKLFGSIWQTIKDVFYNIDVIASGCWEIIKLVWGIVASWFNENIIQPLSNFFKGLWDGFVEKAKSAWEAVKSVFSTVASFFGNIFSAAWAGIVKVFSPLGEVFEKIKDGVLAGFKVVVNGLIKGINAVVSIPFKGINSVLTWLRDLNILGITPFSSIRTINIPQIPALASGGMVNTGQMFIAREAGPEMVGSIGSRSVVMNNDQIVESVARGVEEANYTQNALLREQNGILRRILEKDTSVPAFFGTGNIVSSLERKNTRDGRTVVPVGV